MRINLRAVIPALVIGSLAAIQSFASPIVLGVNGAVDVVDSSIIFGQNQNSGPFTPGGMGVFTVTPPVGSLFSANGVVANETGKIQSLDNTIAPVGTVLATPVQFMTFDTGGSNLVLYVTQLLAGSTLGPFNLSDTTNGATASFSVDGFIKNTTDNSVTGYIGLFDNTFAGLTVAQLIALDATTGVITPYSGTFTLTITPEPASLLLMGIGLLGAGIIARKKIRA